MDGRTEAGCKNGELAENVHVKVELIHREREMGIGIGRGEDEGERGLHSRWT